MKEILRRVVTNAYGATVLAEDIKSELYREFDANNQNDTEFILYVETDREKISEG